MLHKLELAMTAMILGGSHLGGHPVPVHGRTASYGSVKEIAGKTLQRRASLVLLFLSRQKMNAAPHHGTDSWLRQFKMTRRYSGRRWQDLLCAKLC